MANRKKTGSYYTPSYLANFIIEYLTPTLNSINELSFLEPSAGDGSFINAFNEKYSSKTKKSVQFHVVEKINTELIKAQLKTKGFSCKNVHYTFEQNDFLKFQRKAKDKFSCIIGNPPYIKKSLLTKAQIAICKEIHINAGFAPTSVRNIWTSCLISACKLLNDDGVLAYVLPSELLQVNFSVELRAFLIKQFERLEIFTFDDLLFECKGQDTVLLFAYKKHQNKGQFYAHVNNLEQLVNNDFSLKSNSVLVNTKTKWTHHSLASDDIVFLHKISSASKNVDYYCISKPGIVTAGNNFFIVNKEIEEQYGLTNYLKPIIQKSAFVNGSVCFSSDDYEKILQDSKPAKLLSLTTDDISSLTRGVKNYLKYGVQLGLPNSYKCSRRNYWYIVPNVGNVPEGLFFRRIHQYPKLIRNDAKVLVTDTAYKVDMRDGFDINDLIFSFYNSLTLAFSELSGRYYGGGVLELTPQEFKMLPVPLVSIKKKDFKAFNNEFRNNGSISSLIDKCDYKVLNSALKLSFDDIDRVKSIYNKLVAKRFRKA